MVMKCQEQGQSKQHDRYSGVKCPWEEVEHPIAYLPTLVSSNPNQDLELVRLPNLNKAYLAAT